MRAAISINNGACPVGQHLWGPTDCYMCRTPRGFEPENPRCKNPGGHSWLGWTIIPYGAEHAFRKCVHCGAARQDRTPTEADLVSVTLAGSGGGGE